MTEVHAESDRHCRQGQNKRRGLSRLGYAGGKTGCEGRQEEALYLAECASKPIERVKRLCKSFMSAANERSPNTDGSLQFECGHFKKTNEWLKERYGDDGPIDWNLDVSPVDAGI